MRHAAWILAALAAGCAGGPPAPSDRPPNIVLILADDLGWADVSCQGTPAFRTPRIDALAREGTRFTDFYVAQAVCTASRAALLSGSYPNRVGLQGALNHSSPAGIHENELLLSEICKSRGYATAIYGKWHLGLPPYFHPSRHGFDEFFGIPYSNDNGPLHPVVRGIPALPLYDGEKVVETDPDQSLFTRRISDKAVDFIRRNRERPFFLYLPHIMPHVPIFASDAFRGRSKGGLYGDVIEELDAGVGAVLDALRDNGLEERTIVIFMSDNGPFLSYGTHAGSSKPLREGKLTTWEGGVRVPCVMRWPGRIPAGRVCAEPLSAMDYLPTFARYMGASLPERKIDGKDVGDVLEGRPDARSPHEALFFYGGEELQAVRSGPWKLHFEHDYLTVAAATRTDGKPANWENMKPAAMSESGIRGIASRHGYRVERTPKVLYNLVDDPSEARDVAAQHPEVVAKLEALAEGMRADLGDALQNRRGPGVRPAGRR